MAWRWTSDVKIRPNKGRNPKHCSHKNSSTPLSKKMETKSTDINAWGLRRRHDQAIILKLERTSFESTKIKWPRGTYNQFWEYRKAYRNTGLQAYMNTTIMRITCIFEQNSLHISKLIISKLQNHFADFILPVPIPFQMIF